MRATRAATSSIAQVDAVLTEIGAGQIPQLLVYNKIDRARDRRRASSATPTGARRRCGSPPSSAVGLDLLTSAVAERLARFARRARLRVPASAGALRSRLYAAQAVRAEELGTGRLASSCAVELPDLELLTLARTAGVQILEVQATRHALCPRESLPTIVGRFERDQTSAKRTLSLWPGINRTVARRTRGDAVPERAGPTSMSA